MTCYKIYVNRFELSYHPHFKSVFFTFYSLEDQKPKIEGNRNGSNKKTAPTPAPHLISSEQYKISQILDLDAISVRCKEGNAMKMNGKVG